MKKISISLLFLTSCVVSAPETGTVPDSGPADSLADASPRDAGVGLPDALSLDASPVDALQLPDTFAAADAVPDSTVPDTTAQPDQGVLDSTTRDSALADQGVLDSTTKDSTLTDQGVLDSTPSACDHAIPLISAPLSVTHSTSAESNDFSVPAHGCPNWDYPEMPLGSEGRDVMYVFVPATSGNYQITLDSDASLTAYVALDCHNPGSACIATLGDPPAGIMTSKDFVTYLEAGISYYLVIDGWSNDHGEFTLSIQAFVPDPQCSPFCAGRECATDGCQGECGHCAMGEICNPAGICQLPGAGNTCQNPLLLPSEIPVTASGNTETATNDTSILVNTCPGDLYWLNLGMGSSDQVWLFYPPEGRRYRFTTSTQFFSGTLSVATDCADLATSCIGAYYIDGRYGPDSWEVYMEANQPHYIVIDGRSNDANWDGKYEFTIEATQDPIGCGNTTLDNGEACDLGILEGEPDACPTQCDQLQLCVKRSLLDAYTCQARCVDNDPIAEVDSGDFCCPNGSSPSNDKDCPPELPWRDQWTEYTAADSDGEHCQYGQAAHIEDMWLAIQPAACGPVALTATTRNPGVPSTEKGELHLDVMSPGQSFEPQVNEVDLYLNSDSPRELFLLDAQQQTLFVDATWDAEDDCNTPCSLGTGCPPPFESTITFEMQAYTGLQIVDQVTPAQMDFVAAPQGHFLAYVQDNSLWMATLAGTRLFPEMQDEASWSLPVQVSTGPATSPSLTFATSSWETVAMVYVVWIENATSIKLAQMNAGQIDTPITLASGDQLRWVRASNLQSGQLVVAWLDTTATESQLHVALVDGSNGQVQTSRSIAQGDLVEASMAVNEQDIQLVWTENAANATLHHVHINGDSPTLESMAAPAVVDVDAVTPSTPDVYAASMTAFVMWTDSRDGHPAIYLRHGSVSEGAYDFADNRSFMLTPPGQAAEQGRFMATPNVDGLYTQMELIVWQQPQAADPARVGKIASRYNHSEQLTEYFLSAGGGLPLGCDTNPVSRVLIATENKNKLGQISYAIWLQNQAVYWQLIPNWMIRRAH